jgi:hypothetical protein
MFKIISNNKSKNINFISNDEFINLLLEDHTLKKNILLEKENIESIDSIDLKVISAEKWEEKIFFDENKIKMKEIVAKELDDISINILSNQKNEDTSVVVDRRKKKKN